MKRVFCTTCAAVDSAEVAPLMVWASSGWGRTGTCCRCGKERLVMEYELVPTKEAGDHG